MRYVMLISMIFGWAGTLAQPRSAAAPDFVTLQYAGSIGYISGGVGYDIFKGRGRTSLHFGSVPKAHGGPLDIFAGKLFLTPWNVEVSDRVSLHPFDPGIMISYHMGDDFKLSVPDYLSTDNYYWWHTALRLHLAGETSVSVSMPESRLIRRFTAYAEWNSNDLYIVSYFSNASTLRLDQLIKVGVGARLSF